MLSIQPQEVPVCASVHRWCSAGRKSLNKLREDDTISTQVLLMLIQNSAFTGQLTGESVAEFSAAVLLTITETVCRCLRLTTVWYASLTLLNASLRKARRRRQSAAKMGSSIYNQFNTFIYIIYYKRYYIGLHYNTTIVGEKMNCGYTLGTITIVFYSPTDKLCLLFKYKHILIVNLVGSRICPHISVCRTTTEGTLIVVQCRKGRVKFSLV